MRKDGGPIPRSRRSALIEWEIPSWPGLSRLSTPYFLTQRLDVDARHIGERSDAVLRTAMRGMTKRSHEAGRMVRLNAPTACLSRSAHALEGKDLLPVVLHAGHAPVVDGRRIERRIEPAEGRGAVIRI